MRSSRRLAGPPPAASQMRAAPDPRILTGWSGASPHVLRFPCGLSSGFPFARRVLPLRPPSSGFPSSGVLRFVPSAVARVPGSPSVSLRVPLPLSNLHDSAAVGRFRRRWSGRLGPRSPVPAATTPRPDLAVIRPALQMGNGWARCDVATESPVTSGRERRTPPRPSRADRRGCARLAQDHPSHSVVLERPGRHAGPTLPASPPAVGPPLTGHVHDRGG